MKNITFQNCDVLQMVKKNMYCTCKECRGEYTGTIGSATVIPTISLNDL